MQYAYHSISSRSALFIDLALSQGISILQMEKYIQCPAHVLVIHCQHSFLELLVGDPEANIPCHQSGKGRVEALVKCKEPLILGRFHRT